MRSLDITWIGLPMQTGTDLLIAFGVLTVLLLIIWHTDRASTNPAVKGAKTVAFVAFVVVGVLAPGLYLQNVYQSAGNAKYGAARAFKVVAEGFSQMGTLAPGSTPGSIELVGGNELLITPAGGGSGSSYTVNLPDSNVAISGSITPSNTGWCFKETTTGSEPWVYVYNQDGLVSDKAGLADCISGIAYGDNGRSLTATGGE